MKAGENNESGLKLSDCLPCPSVHSAVRDDLKYDPRELEIETRTEQGREKEGRPDQSRNNQTQH